VATVGRAIHRQRDHEEQTMSIAGFEDDSTDPINLWIDDVVGVGVGPFQVDGTATSSNAAGILAFIAATSTRYFIPWQHVRGVTQVQTAETPGNAPIITPPNPGSGGGSGGGGG
jgi:hypothetical protein